MRLLVIVWCAISLAVCAGSGPVVAAASIAPETGSTSAPVATPAPAPSADVLISYTRSGGLAGFADSYDIRGDGSVAVVASRRAPDTVFAVAGGTAAVQRLVAALAATGLYDLPLRGPALLAGGDRMSYEITVHHAGKALTFTTADGADDPAALRQALELVQQYILAAQSK